MKVLYDYQIFHNQKFGGISQYFTSLFNQFAQSKDIEVEIALKSSHNEHLKSYDAQYFKREPQSSFQLINKLARKNDEIRNRRYAQKLIHKNEFDLFHPSYYDTYFIDQLKSPMVITVYDMIHERFKEQYQLADTKTYTAKKILCEKAAKIIAISHHTKKDIIELLQIPEEKIEVIHLASNYADQNKNVDKTIVSSLPKKYVLYVGQRGMYKNFETFFRAMAPLLKEDDELNIVCTGQPFSPSELRLFEDLGINKNRLFQFFANDSTLKVIYQNARAFVFPSLYEGFGIPILEAFHSECPALLSNTSCLPEIGGESAEYFDPRSEYEIKEVIKNVIYDESRRKELINKGRERIKLFSWAKTASETLKCYQFI